MTPLPPPPIPIEPLGYYRPVGPGRPGILVAVGVLSIIFGAFGALTGCFSVFSTFVFSQVPIPVPVPPSTSGPAVFEDYSRSALDRMAPEKRTAVINVLSRSEPLPEVRRQLLDRLLARAGDDIFTLSDANIDEARILTSLNASGRVADPQGRGSNYFIVANGRIEISDTDAVFMPQRQGPTIRVLSEDEIIEQTVTAGSSARRRLAPTTLQFTTGPRASFAMMATNVGAAAANMLLAIYLLVIGIMVVSNSPRGRRLHLIYAYLKLPLAIITAIASALMMQQLFAGTGAGIAMNVGMSVSLIVNMLFACMYPIAVLIVMNTRTVRRYYMTDA